MMAIQSPIKLSMAGTLYGFVFADGKEDNLEHLHKSYSVAGV
jgi:hypothetical protein